MPQKVLLNEVAGGALQEKFEKAMKEVMENIKDVNTNATAARAVTIKLTFTPDELREDISSMVTVTTKTAPVVGVKTNFLVGKDLKTGEIDFREYGRQIPGQMSMDDLPATEDSDKVTNMGPRKLIN